MDLTCGPLSAFAVSIGTIRKLGCFGSYMSVKDMWSDRDVHYHAGHRALLDGTARAKLAADFEDSDLDYEELGKLVGHVRSSPGRRCWRGLHGRSVLPGPRPPIV